MDSAIVENGYIEVTRDGHFFRTYNGRECTLTKSKIRGDYYYYITYMEVDGSGKQMLRLAHKLYAEAFIPNHIGEKAVVMAKDGNLLNISDDNLYWATKTDRTNAHYEESKPYRVKCVGCGKKFYKLKTGEFCGKCKVEEKIKKENKDKRLRRIKESFAHVDFSPLPYRDEQMAMMRMEGFTLKDIGKKYGISGEAVRIILKNIREKGVKNE